MNKKIPNPIDTHVGGRVRLRRMMLGMSQEKLGEQLGITFQQIQKYEKGTNRIGASRLQHIARVLTVPVSHFFEGAPGSDKPEPAADEADRALRDFLVTQQGLELNKAFVKIANPQQRRAVVQLVRSIAGGEDETKAAA